MKTFTIYRRGDLSATHDKNQVNAPDKPQAEGVVFDDGTVALRWLTAAQSTSIWQDMETMLKIHGHTDPNSKHGTEIVWHNPQVSNLRRVMQNTKDMQLNEELRNLAHFVLLQLDGMSDAEARAEAYGS